MMELLFKSTGSTVGESNFRDYYPQVNSNMRWKDFEVEIHKVTRDLVIPYITTEFYEFIVEFRDNDPATLQPLVAEVLELLQDCIANYTIWRLSPKKNIAIGDMGIQESHSKDGTNPAASAWRYFHHYWTVMKEADQLLDKVLEKLESGDPSLGSFDKSNAELIINNQLLRTTAEFQQFVYLNNSRRTFRKLIPSIQAVERRDIQPILGADQYNVLIQAIHNLNLDDKQEALLKKAQEAIAHSSLHLAIPHLSVMIENAGIMVISSTDGMNSKQTAQKEKIISLMEQAEKDTKTALAALKDFLYLNEDDYPLWKSSEAYNHFDGSSAYPMTFGAGGVFLG